MKDDLVEKSRREGFTLVSECWVTQHAIWEPSRDNGLVRWATYLSNDKRILGKGKAEVDLENGSYKGGLILESLL